MWFLIIALMVAAVGGGALYLAKRMRKFKLIEKAEKSCKAGKALSFIAVLTAFVVLWLLLGLMNAMVCMIHAVIFWLICDCAAYFVKKMTGKKPKRYYAGLCAVVITVAYLSFGAFFAHHVYRTEYDITAQKNISQPLKIVLFSDSHVGATFDWKKFSEYVDEMNAQKPDVVVIAGDYVDDETDRENMEKSCEALRKLKTKYGVYYAFGNHDAGYYSDVHRGYGKDDLISNLERNGVVVLQDETVNIVGNYYLCGRQDSSLRDRIDMDMLMMGIPDDAYFIVLDHEPGDYEAQCKAKADLVLSGHTHGGQLIPINKVGEWFGINDMTYGHKRIENTDFIVSSGIGDWELDFKTGCISEYVVVNVH